jgi:hypothetical protein
MVGLVVWPFFRLRVVYGLALGNDRLGELFLSESCAGMLSLSGRYISLILWFFTVQVVCLTFRQSHHDSSGSFRLTPWMGIETFA